MASRAPTNRPTIPPLWYATAAIIGVLLLKLLLAPQQLHDSIPYSAVEGYLCDGRIAEMTVTDHYI
jgi:hypothetical protein